VSEYKQSPANCPEANRQADLPLPLEPVYAPDPATASDVAAAQNSVPEASNQQALELLYRDQHLVVINKPSGLLVHRSPIDRHETRFALQLVRDQIGQYVYPVHRLDKPTSGALIFALDRDSARQLSASFANAAIRKRYLAVVRGYAPQQCLIDHPLSQQFDKMTTTAANKPPQQATTALQRLATVELPHSVDRYPHSRYSLVQLQPTTGRKHQLRRHLKHIAHPIIGDAKHGKGLHNRFFQQHYNCQRLLLACTELQFTHPVSGQPLTVTAGLDSSFSRIISAFGWQSVVADIMPAAKPVC